eukprot:c10362_g1_i1 orf=2-307(-)
MKKEMDHSPFPVPSSFRPTSKLQPVGIRILASHPNLTAAISCNQANMGLLRTPHPDEASTLPHCNDQTILVPLLARTSAIVSIRSQPPPLAGAPEGGGAWGR